MTFFSFVPFTMRLKVTLDSFGKKVSLPRFIKQAIAGFSVSYITPASRFGGEPVRIYMLKKESSIDYETSTSAIILDKFVEILGSALYGVIGLFLLSIGIDTPIGQLILIINIWGLINFIPVPGGLGFLESSQSVLFHLIQGSGVEGLAMALLLCVGYLLVVVVGLFLLSKFSIKQFFKKKKFNKNFTDTNSQA